MRGRGWWAGAFVLCSLASAVPLLITYRLPMADLPQHAVQLTVWKHFYDTCYLFHDFYEINWLTPYLLGTFVMHVVAMAMPVHAALKLVVYLTLIAIPLVLERIAEFAGLDPWIALIGFPLGFGFTFYWGFVNFNVVIPAVLLLLLYLCRISRQNAGAVAVTALFAVFFGISHALVYAVSVVVAVPMMLVRRLWWHAAAMLAPMPLLLAWVVRSQSQQVRARVPWEWQLHPRRLLQIFDFLLSAGGDADAFWFAVVLVIAALLLGVGVAAERWRWIPFLAATAAFLFAPFSALGQTLLYPRLSTIIPATALIALAPRAPRINVRLARALLVLAVLTWMTILAARFRTFDRDADGFDRLVDSIPSNQRVLLLNVVQSAEITGMPFLHWSGHYFERKGGLIGWSFAANFPAVIRYRPGFNPGVPPIITHDPRFFDWKQHSHFDYFIVRAPVDMTPLMFRDAGGAAQLRQRAGLWWLYENLQRAHDREACPPLEPDADHEPLLNMRW